MNFLTPICHPVFESFYKKFDNIFSEPSQRVNFRLYGTGLMLEIKRKNIWYMNEHIIDSDYQPMHHYMHDSPWYESDLNDQRVDILDKNRSTKSCDDGYAIIDDTGNPKSGDSTHFEYLLISVFVFSTTWHFHGSGILGSSISLWERWYTLSSTS